MKVLLIGLLFCVSVITQAQQRMTEKQVMKESHIDFSRQYIYFTLHGLIEIDGHIFKNDTCKCPIIYQATLDGITIIDTCTKVKYVHRKCNVKGCKIIHLNKEELEVVDYDYWPKIQPFLDHQLDLTVPDRIHQ
jgi:hypothetical protein